MYQEYKGCVNKMKQNEYIKFMTEQLVTYMDKPKEERKKTKNNKEQNGFSNRWLGLFPFTIKLLLKK